MENTDRSVEAAVSLGNCEAPRETEEGGEELCMAAETSNLNQELQSIPVVTDLNDEDPKEVKEEIKETEDMLERKENNNNYMPQNPPELLKDVALKLMNGCTSNPESSTSTAMNNNARQNQIPNRFLIAAPPELLRDVYCAAHQEANQTPDVCCYSKKADKVVIPELDFIERRITQLFEEENEETITEANHLIDQTREVSIPITETNNCPIQTNAISARAQLNRARFSINDKSSFGFQVFMLFFGFMFVISYFLLLKSTEEHPQEIESR